MRTLRTIFYTFAATLVIAFGSMVSGCGQKGPLYLPQSETVPAPGVKPEPASEKADDSSQRKQAS